MTQELFQSIRSLLGNAFSLFPPESGLETMRDTGNGDDDRLRAYQIENYYWGWSMFSHW